MHFLTDRRGVAAIEFALCVPLLIFFMLALIDLGRFAMLSDSMATGVSRAARTAMVGSTDSSAPASAASIRAIVLESASVPDVSQMAVTVSWKNNQNVVGSTVTITASYPFRYFTPEFFVMLAPRTVTRQQTLTIVT